MPDPGGSPPSRLPWPLRRRRSDDFDGFKSRSGNKSIWKLLPIPIAAAIITAGFGLWQAYLSGQQHQSDQQLARDQQRATILQAYIDNMRDLLLNPNLTKSTPPGDRVRQLARVQTLTALRSLDANRNRIVLHFLQDAHLVGAQDAIINLSNADLSGADLEGAPLSGIDMLGTDFSDAILSGANLIRANLSGAILNGANLSGANLSEAFLNSATLTSADMNGARLTNASLTSAFLGNANLDGAALTAASLNGADLIGAKLNDADLSGASLSGADLTNADVSGADFTDADLVDNVSQQQLDAVYSCTKSALSIGLTCHHHAAITLTYWYTESPAEAPVIQELIYQFERIYPGIHIDAVNKNYFQTEAQFVNAAEQGKAPDVLRSDISWVAQFASQSYLLSIDPYISQENLSDYLSVPLNSDYYRGHIYGLPQVTDFLALLYNKAELKKAGINSLPPATMAKFETDAKDAVQRKAARYGFETDGTGYNALPFLYAFGGGMFDQHNHILVKSDGSVNGLRFLLNLQNTDKVMPANVNFTLGTVSPIVTDFMTGKTAMIFGGPYSVREILTGSSFKGNASNLGIAPIPTCPPGYRTCHAGQTGSPLGGQSYVISTGARHPFEAYKFISFMSSTASQVAIAKANNTLPTRRSAYQDDEVSRNQFISEFLRITSTAIARPSIPQAGHLFDAFNPNIAAALEGVESPITALTAVADAWKQLLVRQ